MSEAVTEQLRHAVRTIQALRARVAALQTERNPPIAIVGMACRFAGAADTAALWRLLETGGDAVRPIPSDRWDNAAWFSPDPDAPGRVVFREAAFLDDVDGFDNDLFQIAAREAAGMDPQHRLALELAWSALEDAAIRPDGLAGSSTGVFLGLNGGDHLLATLSAPDRLGTHSLAGSVASIAAGRLAYAFGLSGPAIIVDTACSSSLVAVHLAVQSLRHRECSLALAGGVHLMLGPHVSVALSRARMMAPDGRCKAFDEAADGFGQGEGGGIVVLRRLADAVAAGDRILAVIGGSAVNQDGRSAGISAPNQRAQEAVIRAALVDADILPDAVDGIEAHGTGTALGDPLELHALASVFRSRSRALAIGSVKTNIGHTAAAAGVAGLIKAVLMLRHQGVPPNPHFRRLNPHVSLDGLPLEIPTALRSQPLNCLGVSSFGFSGTNAHLVLRRAPDGRSEQPAPPGLLLSARSTEALRILMSGTRARLQQGLAFEDACLTAWRGRARLGWWAWVSHPDELADAEPRQGPLPAPEAMAAGGRIAELPPYPFERRHFPRLASLVATGVASRAARFPGHRLDSPSADRQHECMLDVAVQPWLLDHRVQGRVIVPGAVMIALLLSVAPPPANALADIRFIEPVILDGSAVRLVALGRPDGSLQVSSRTGTGWTTHATARTASGQAALVLAGGSAAGGLTRQGWVAHLEALGIRIGPVFQAIDTIVPGPVTCAMLDDAVLDGPAGEAFHPALLDAVLQVAGGTLPAEPVLPVGISHLTLHAPLTGALQVVARRDCVSVDLAVRSRERPVASIAGLTVRRLNDSLPPTVAALEWTAMAAPQRDGAPPAIIEILPGGANLPDVLALVHRQLAAAAPLAFVTRGATPPVSDPAAALFAGFATALDEERPELGCRCIDVTPGTPEALLKDELSSRSTEPLVALRPDGRFVPRLAPIPWEASTLRLSGTVLITGGLGGIGLTTAAWAIARGADAVLLVSRRGGRAPSELPARILELDVASPDAVPSLRAALTGMPPLRTVVHAAGVLRDGLIEDLREADFVAALAPKLAGARNLHELTRDVSVDHFLLFGSVASLIGAAGQANYAAANAALDAFAHWRRAQGLPAQSIAWGRWQGTGMAAGLSKGQTARVAARGLLAMTPARALAALEVAIRSDRPVVMVAALELERLAGTAPPIFANLLGAPMPESGPLVDQVGAAVRLILGQAAPAGRPLVACGLDSLMAMDLRNRLNRRFRISLGMTDLMGGADIVALADAVERAIEANGAPASGAMEEITL